MTHPLCFVHCSQAAEEKAAEAAGRARELYEENKRLEDHIHDLETRKRAPLYQKKQEEELKAAVEKAQDAEIRAAEAELKCKEAKVCTQNSCFMLLSSLDVWARCKSG